MSIARDQLILNALKASRGETFDGYYFLKNDDEILTGIDEFYHDGKWCRNHLPTGTLYNTGEHLPFRRSLREELIYFRKVL
jgi:hypothetical protein